MSIITIHVKTLKDVARLKKLLDGFEAKSVFIYSKEEYCKSEHLSIFSEAMLRYKPILLLDYIKCRYFKRFHQVFHTYNVKYNILAFICKPWRIVITDGIYRWLYHGRLEKIYQKLKVEVYNHEIYVVVDEW